MKTYIIREVVIYQVDAESAEEAEEKFLNAEDINEFLSGVDHREVYE
jgi:hypothetical protein